LAGARNVALRTLVMRRDWMTTGQLSDAPEGSDDEAKAARLQRYAPVAVESGHKPRAVALGSFDASARFCSSYRRSHQPARKKRDVGGSVPTSVRSLPR